MRAILFLAVLVSTSACVVSPESVSSGERGVLWTASSGTQPEAYEEGWTWVAMWNKFYTYSVRTHDVKEQLNAITQDRLQLPVEVSIRFRVDPGSVVKLHKTYGPKYYEAAIGSPIRSAVRKVVGSNSLEEVYSTRRKEVEEAIFAELEKDVPEDLFVIENVFIRDIALPEKVKAAIEKKLMAEQEAQEMDFRLAKEKKEAERKEIEVRGIQKFQSIVRQGIDARFLKWKGIEATQELAKSNNAKIVIIGGEDGLPVILNQ